MLLKPDGVPPIALEEWWRRQSPCGLVARAVPSNFTEKFYRNRQTTPAIDKIVLRQAQRQDLHEGKARPVRPALGEGGTKDEQPLGS
jgi:hypothetical protein